MATINLPIIRSLPSLRFSSIESSQIISKLPFLSYPNPNPSYPLPLLSISPNLYSKSKARASSIITFAAKNLSETELISVPEISGEISAHFPSDAGVYAIYDENSDVQFIGITRNIAGSVVVHRKSVPELCVSVKFGTVDEPDRNTLAQAWKSWMEEHIKATGKVPPGNESGNTTWVRQPPKKKPDLRLTPGRHVQLTVPLEDLIEQLVKENKVVAFIKGSRSAPLCGFSQKVIGILETEGVDYESVDVLDEEYNNGLRETLKKYSSWPTFPQIFVDGQLIGGCDILSSMQEKGELADLFKK